MANQENLDILKQGVEVWNQWRMKNYPIVPDLSRTDLRDANLSDINLSRADLRDANLSHANLRNAWLDNAVFCFQEARSLPQKCWHAGAVY